MGILAAGSVILVPFPFSDLSQMKLRPAVVLADVGRGDWILCQITSNMYGDKNAVRLDYNDFLSGALRITSYARPGKLFTSNQNLAVKQIGSLKHESLKKIIEKIMNILHEGISMK